MPLDKIGDIELTQLAGKIKRLAIIRCIFSSQIQFARPGQIGLAMPQTEPFKYDPISTVNRCGIEFQCFIAQFDVELLLIRITGQVYRAVDTGSLQLCIDSSRIQIADSEFGQPECLVDLPGYVTGNTPFSGKFDFEIIQFYGIFRYHDFGLQCGQRQSVLIQ